MADWLRGPAHAAVVVLALALASSSILTSIALLAVLPGAQDDNRCLRDAAVNGGWQFCTRSSVSTLNADPSIRMCERMTLAEWNMLSEEEISALQGPVLVENAVIDWPAHSKWRRKDMHGTYGHVKFKLDKEKDVSNHQNRNMTWLSMAEYLDKLASNKSDGLLMFDRSGSMPPEMLADIVRPVHPPQFRDDDVWQHTTLSLGGHRSGVPWHSHPRTWNALLFGEKRWLFFPGTKMLSSEYRAWFIFGKTSASDWQRDHNGIKRMNDAKRKTSYEWVAGRYRDAELRREMVLHGWECVQRPGELVYFGDWLFHMTVNRGEVLSVVSEMCADGQHADARCRPVYRDFQRQRHLARESAVASGVSGPVA